MNAPENRGAWLRPKLIASWHEIVAVLVLSIGYFVFVSTVTAFHRWNGHLPDLRASNYRMLHLMAIESCLLALFLGFLSWRGWQPSDFKIAPGRESTWHGLYLLLAWLVVASVFTAYRRHWNFLIPPLVHAPAVRLHHLHLGWLVLILSQVINAFYEELIVMGYGFNQLAAKRGPGLALALTMLLRISYHTWMSPLSLVETAISFLIFGVYYQRTGNLWPLVLAHALYDILIFMPWASGLY